MEWRMILPIQSKDTGREWKMLTPSKILLGAKAKKSIEEQILKLAESRKIPVKRMQLSKASHQMVEVELARRLGHLLVRKRDPRR
jgi:hypothetical protein